MTKELVDDIVQSGKVLEQANGEKYVYITTKGVVVVSQDGKLITGWSKDYFDEEMKEIIKILLKEEI